MICGLIGNSVSLSLSPFIHQAFFASAGIDGQYRLIDVAGEDLGECLNSLSAAPEYYRGINVTIPHKVAVLAHLDQVSNEAAVAGAVNTIVFTYDDHSDFSCRRSGYNTDISGLKTSLLHSMRLHHFSIRKAALIGAGGSARAAVIALAMLGVSDLLLICRSRERGEAFIQTITTAIEDAQLALPVLDFSLQVIGENRDTNSESDFESALSSCSILINATSIGHINDDCPQWLPELISTLPGSAFVQDLVYAKGEKQTVFCRLAEEKNLRFEDGKAMLVHQARFAFELWTGYLPSFEIGMDAARF